MLLIPRLKQTQFSLYALIVVISLICSACKIVSYGLLGQKRINLSAKMLAVVRACLLNFINYTNTLSNVMVTFLVPTFISV